MYRMFTLFWLLFKKRTPCSYVRIFWCPKTSINVCRILHDARDATIHKNASFAFYFSHSYSLSLCPPPLSLSIFVCVSIKARFLILCILPDISNQIPDIIINNYTSKRLLLHNGPKVLVFSFVCFCFCFIFKTMSVHFSMLNRRIYFALLLLLLLLFISSSRFFAIVFWYIRLTVWRFGRHYIIVT